MRHPRAYALAGFAIAVAGAVAFAQTTVTPLAETPLIDTQPLDASAVAALAQARPGDPQAGATLAGTCAACHGLDGNGTDPTVYPRIAGHSERYTARQLALFKSGERASAIMQPYAAPLSAQDMRDLGAWYATQETGAGIADDTEVAEGQYAGMKFYAVGEQLFRRGDMARGIPACMACHGPDGSGNPGPPYPHVAGQQSWYSARRLQEYRAGETLERERVLFNVMAEVAKPLSDEEISALASYMQGLHRRPDVATLAAMAALPPSPAPAAQAPFAPDPPEADGPDDDAEDDGQATEQTTAQGA
ncbi:c-type cytochrome [soil metagenome]